MRSVWSRLCVGSVTLVLPLANMPASSTALFTCALATGLSVMDRLQVAAFDDERRAAVLALGGDLRAHLGERLDDAAHRALGERGVADEPAAEGLPGEDAGEQAHGGAGVAAVDVAASAR